MPELEVDVEMAETADMGGDATAEVTIGDAPAPEEEAGAGGASAAEENTEVPDADAAAEQQPEHPDDPAPSQQRITFASYLQSPIVNLTVGEGDEQTTWSVHEALLKRSPYFATKLETKDTIDLSHENVDAVGCFLEYLYTGDYFPRKLAGHSHRLEPDPSLPDIDESGVQLLKHARIYTLAGILDLPELQALATSKIHCVNSTAKGEIAYARYVYAHTTPQDTVVRSPVAKFWATRSHTLRAEAEAEFMALCLEHPQFSYDILTRVLDEKLKRERNDKAFASPSGTRKRARGSSTHGL